MYKSQLASLLCTSCIKEKNTQTFILRATFVAHLMHHRETECTNVHSFPQLTESLSLSYITHKHSLCASGAHRHQRHTRHLQKPSSSHAHLVHMLATCLVCAAIVCSVMLVPMDQCVNPQHRIDVCITVIR